MEEQNTQMTQAETLAQMMAADMEERKKALYRHKMPAQNTLKDMLTAMTKAELDDIRFNLNVSGTSSLKKAELVERLVPEVLNFARLWLPS
ncbi:MAG: zinc chelation protein SecC, partial [Selenomonas sp.]|nr:zinc chelation protein SecC [Selenomonas sp.]